MIKLKKYLKNKGISITDLSEQSGIPYSTLSDYLNQGAEMPFSNAVKIARVLNIKVETLGKLLLKEETYD